MGIGSLTQQQRRRRQQQKSTRAPEPKFRAPVTAKRSPVGASLPNLITVPVPPVTTSASERTPPRHTHCHTSSRDFVVGRCVSRRGLDSRPISFRILRASRRGRRLATVEPLYWPAERRQFPGPTSERNGEPEWSYNGLVQKRWWLQRDANCRRTCFTFRTAAI